MTRGIFMTVGKEAAAELITESDLRNAQARLITGTMTPRDGRVLDALVSHALRHWINAASTLEERASPC